jgi:hypothetical protein
MRDVRTRRATTADVEALREVARSAYLPYVETIGVRPAPLDTDNGSVENVAQHGLAELRLFTHQRMACAGECVSRSSATPARARARSSRSARTSRRSSTRSSTRTRSA